MFDRCLKLTVEDSDMKSFLRSSLWKLRMPLIRRYDHQIDGNTLVFPDIDDIHELPAFKEELQGAGRWGLELVLDKGAAEAISTVEGALEQKVGVGNAIKAKDDEVFEDYYRFKSIVDGEMVRPLCEQQMWDAFFMSSMEKSANFSVPGSGKTAATLGVFAYLRHMGKVRRLLVVCPINAFGSWQDEWRACFGDRIPLSALSFQTEENASKTVDGRRRALAYGSGRYNMVLINYEARGLDRELSEIASSETLLVFDEVHKVKMVGGVRADRALNIAKRAQYVVALTGTPIPNSYLDIYNLLHILYPAEYEQYFGFSKDFLKNPDEREVEDINDALQPFFCRTSKDALGVPRPEPDSKVRIDATEVENLALNQLRRSLRGDPLALIVRIMQLESDPSMLLDAVPDECFDVLLDTLEEARQAKAPVGPKSRKALTSLNEIVAQASYPSHKTARCIELVSSLVKEGKHVLVWCVFRKSMSNICSLLRRAGCKAEMVFGDVNSDDRQRIIGDFRSGAIDVLVTNPQTLAESVSLHDVCHDAVYFEYGYNLVHLLQSKDRINRLGLAASQYTQYYFMQVSYVVNGDAWSLDERIYDRLSEKEDTMLKAIDGGRLEAGSVDDFDMNMVCEGLFEDLDIE